MSFLWMLIVGLVVGAIAKLFMPGRDPGGVIVTMLIGVAGALVAGFLGRAVGWYSEGQPAGFIASILGSILLLAIYRAVIGKAGTGSGTGSRTDRAA
jgi:uncharacterized membrane protein YeaQ/YmgE (transglycosylase-associated protein family)